MRQVKYLCQFLALLILRRLLRHKNQLQLFDQSQIEIHPRHRRRPEMMVLG
jgi:hypothetical protein